MIKVLMLICLLHIYNCDTDVIEDDRHQPYSFAYQVEDAGHHWRRESSDDQGRVRGTFSYLAPDGVVRTTRYVAAPDIGFQVLGEELPQMGPSLGPLKVEGLSGTPVADKLSNSYAQLVADSERIYENMAGTVSSQDMPWVLSQISERDPRLVENVHVVITNATEISMAGRDVTEQVTTDPGHNDPMSSSNVSAEEKITTIETVKDVLDVTKETYTENSVPTSDSSLVSDIKVISNSVESPTEHLLEGPSENATTANSEAANSSTVSSILTQSSYPSNETEGFDDNQTTTEESNLNATESVEVSTDANHNVTKEHTYPKVVGWIKTSPYFFPYSAHARMLPIIYAIPNPYNILAPQYQILMPSQNVLNLK